MLTTRRTILRGSLAGALGLSLPPLLAVGARAQAAGLQAIPLTDRVTQITGAGSNVVCMQGAPEGLLLVDGGLAEHTDALLSQLQAVDGQGRVATLFNTHWHEEQTGSNEVFSAQGAEIIAHENTRLWLGTDIHAVYEDKIYRARPFEAAPTQTFYKEGSMQAGPERIDYGYLIQAHTDGDIYVFFRDSDVLVAGDVVSAVRDPALDYLTNGWFGGMVEGLASLLALAGEDTRIVPGFGPALSRAELQGQHDQMLALYDRMVDMMEAGVGPHHMTEAGLFGESPRAWSDPDTFADHAYRGLWGHVRSLGDDIV